MDTLVSITKAAKFLGVCAETLRVWDNEGKLKAVRTKGGHRRYKLSDIEKMMEIEAE